MVSSTLPVTIMVKEPWLLALNTMATRTAKRLATSHERMSTRSKLCDMCAAVLRNLHGWTHDMCRNRVKRFKLGVSFALHQKYLFIREKIHFWLDYSSFFPILPAASHLGQNRVKNVRPSLVRWAWGTISERSRILKRARLAGWKEVDEKGHVPFLAQRGARGSLLLTILHSWIALYR